MGNAPHPKPSTSPPPCRAAAGLGWTARTPSLSCLFSSVEGTRVSVEARRRHRIPPDDQVIVVHNRVLHRLGDNELVDLGPFVRGVKRLLRDGDLQHMPSRLGTASWRPGSGRAARAGSPRSVCPGARSCRASPLLPCPAGRRRHLLLRAGQDDCEAITNPPNSQTERYIRVQDDQ